MENKPVNVDNANDDAEARQRVIHVFHPIAALDLTPIFSLNPSS